MSPTLESILKLRGDLSICEGLQSGQSENSLGGEKVKESSNLLRLPPEFFPLDHDPLAFMVDLLIRSKSLDFEIVAFFVVKKWR